MYLAGYMEERIDSMNGTKRDFLTVRVICDVDGEAIKPIKEFDSTYVFSKYGHFKQAEFDGKELCLVYGWFENPYFSYDMAEVMCNNIPQNISISKYTAIYPTKVEVQEIFNIGQGMEKNAIFTTHKLRFEDLSVHLRNIKLEKFIAPVQRVYQKAWDFLKTNDDKFGKVYPAYVK